MITISGALINQITGSPYPSNITSRLKVELCQMETKPGSRHSSLKTLYTSRVNQTTGRFSLRVPEAVFTLDVILRVMDSTQELRRFSKAYMRAAGANLRLPILLSNATATLTVSLKDENEGASGRNQLVRISGIKDGAAQKLHEERSNTAGRIVYRLTKSSIESFWGYDRPALKIEWLGTEGIIAVKTISGSTNPAKSIQFTKAAELPAPPPKETLPISVSLTDQITGKTLDITPSSPLRLILGHMDTTSGKNTAVVLAEGKPNPQANTFSFELAEDLLPLNLFVKVWAGLSLFSLPKK